MKQYKLIILGLLLSFSFIACKKTNSDRITSVDQLGIGSYIYLDSVINNNKGFSLSTFNTASIGIIVHGVGEPISKIITYVSSSVDASGNPSNSTVKTTWRKIKETTPVDNKATITVSGAEILTALGVPLASIKAGFQYVFYNEIVTTSGKTYNINNTNTEFESAPDYHMAFRFSGTVVCPFDITPFQGNFVVVIDKWQDTNPGDIIVLTPIDATHFSFNYNPTNHPGTLIGSKPIIVTVAPATNTPSIAFQTVGTKWTYDPPGAAPPTARTRSTDANTLNACSGTITLVMMWGEEGTEYPGYTLTLRKQ